MAPQERQPERSLSNGAPPVIAAVVMALAALSALAQPTRVEMPDEARGSDRTWERVASDDFTSPESDWHQGDTSNEYVREVVKMENGRYRWDIRFLEDRGRFWLAPYPAAIEFKVAVDVRFQRHESAGSAAGLIFGHVSGKDYAFKISSKGNYALQTWDGNDWTNVLEWSPVSIKVEEANRLAVVVEHDVLSLYINDELKDELRLTDFSGGKVGLEVFGYEGRHVIVEFDNFEYSRRSKGEVVP